MPDRPCDAREWRKGRTIAGLRRRRVSHPRLAMPRPTHMSCSPEIGRPQVLLPTYSGIPVGVVATMVAVETTGPTRTNAAGATDVSASGAIACPLGRRPSQKWPFCGVVVGTARAFLIRSVEKG